VKALDLTSTTSGNTWNMMINNQYKLFTPNMNDSVSVSYGDSSTQTISLSSSNLLKKNNKKNKDFYFSEIFKKVYYQIM
jgi:hypothetical protein